MSEIEAIKIFLLISLMDLNGAAKNHELKLNIRRRQYLAQPLRKKMFKIAQQDLIKEQYIAAEDSSSSYPSLSLNNFGLIGLRRLCKRAFSTYISSTGQSRMREAILESSEWLFDIGHISLQEYIEQMNWEIKRMQLKVAEMQGEEPPYNILAQARAGRGEGSFYVYVILLQDDLRTKAKDRAGRDPDLPCVYVGQTYLEPEIRFQQHQDDYKASRYVRDYGICLLPQLYEEYNPLPGRGTAEEVEKALAQKLRDYGYSVFGGH
jgi:hypothetical protein